jgi:hypothetical protein
VRVAAVVISRLTIVMTPTTLQMIMAEHQEEVIATLVKGLITTTVALIQVVLMDLTVVVVLTVSKNLFHRRVSLLLVRKDNESIYAADVK